MTSLRRKRKPLLFQTSRFFNLFRRNTEAVLMHGNSAVLYRYGSDFFPALLEAISHARSSICMEFYTICDDATGRMVADALIAAAARGVRAYVIYDYIGCFDTSAAFFKRLSKGGVCCTAFNPPPFKRHGITWFDRRDHRKIVVIDGWRAFTGSINIADVYAGCGKKHAKWRDVGIRIEGGAAGELLRVFCDTWAAERGSPPKLAEPPTPDLAGQAKVMIINGGPHHKRSFIRSAFRMAIAGASESITIASPYFIPGPRVIRSLLRAAGRGVRVRLLLPHKSDVPLVRLVSRTCYAQLLNNDIEIYELDSAVLHAKVMVVDESWAMVGSANMDERSFMRNYELNVVVDSPDFGRQVADMLETDIRAAKKIVLHEHESRGLPVRFMERLFGAISWFL
jgi:cardiolipin synthase A/B